MYHRGNPTVIEAADDIESVEHLHTVTEGDHQVAYLKVHLKPHKAYVEGATNSLFATNGVEHYMLAPKDTTPPAKAHHSTVAELTSALETAKSAQVEAERPDVEPDSTGGKEA